MRHKGCVRTEERLYEDTVEKQPFASQEERPQEEPNC